MDYGQKISEVILDINKKDFNSAKIKLEEILENSQTEKIEDQNTTNYSLNNYVELLMVMRLSILPKKNILPSVNLAEVYYYLGYVHVENGDLKKAMEYLQEGLKWNPVSANIMFEIANIYRMMGDYEKFKEQTERIHEYIYTNEDLAKYYRTLGSYYTHKEMYDVANALYSYSMKFENNYIAHNELGYIAHIENREVMLSKKSDIDQLFKENNIALDFNLKLFSIILEAYNHFMRDDPKNANLVILSETLYNITTDKSFIIPAVAEDEEYGVKIQAPCFWKFITKEQYQMYKISPNTVFCFYILKPKSNKVDKIFSVMSEGKCSDEEFEKKYRSTIEFLLSSGAKILKEFKSVNRENFRQVVVDYGKNEKVLQNYLLVNGYIFHIGWNIKNDMSIDKLVENETNSLEMDVALSLEDAVPNIRLLNSIINSIDLEYNKNKFDGQTLILINHFSKKCIQEDQSNGILSLMSRKMLNLILILNLYGDRKNTIEDLILQAKNLDELVKYLKENIDKVDLEKFEGKLDIKSTMNLLKNNEKLVLNILENVYQSLVQFTDFNDN